MWGILSRDVHIADWTDLTFFFYSLTHWNVHALDCSAEGVACSPGGAWWLVCAQAGNTPIWIQGWKICCKFDITWASRLTLSEHSVQLVHVYAHHLKLHHVHVLYRYCSLSFSLFPPPFSLSFSLSLSLSLPPAAMQRSLMVHLLLHHSNSLQLNWGLSHSSCALLLDPGLPVKGHQLPRQVWD